MTSNTHSTNSRNQLLTVNDASNTFNKSIATIRKLIETNKILYNKENKRILIPIQELIKIYGEIDNSISTNVSTTPETVSNTDSTNISTNQFLERIVEGKEKHIEFLQGEIENKNQEVTRLHRLLENQQSLNLQTSNLLTLERENRNQKKKKFLWF